MHCLPMHPNTPARSRFSISSFQQASQSECLLKCLVLNTVFIPKNVRRWIPVPTALHQTDWFLVFSFMRWINSDLTLNIRTVPYNVHRQILEGGNSHSVQVDQIQQLKELYTLHDPKMVLLYYGLDRLVSCSGQGSLNRPWASAWATGYYPVHWRIADSDWLQVILIWKTDSS